MTTTYHSNLNKITIHVNKSEYIVIYKSEIIVGTWMIDDGHNHYRDFKNGIVALKFAMKNLVQTEDGEQYTLTVT